MNSLLHLALTVDAHTEITTDELGYLGPKLSICDTPGQIDIQLPRDEDRALEFLARLTASAGHLASAIDTHRHRIIRTPRR
jgi:hypothetical protein